MPEARRTSVYLLLLAGIACVFFGGFSAGRVGRRGPQCPPPALRPGGDVTLTRVTLTDSELPRNVPVAMRVVRVAGPDGTTEWLGNEPAAPGGTIWQLRIDGRVYALAPVAPRR